MDNTEDSVPSLARLQHWNNLWDTDNYFDGYRAQEAALEWLKHHAGVVPCELDTVIGSISGGRCGGLFPGDTIVNDTFKVITASLIAPLWGVV